MGAPKQKWTAEEESALKAGIAKHGTGKWCTILKDTEFSHILYSRSNVDLKDKWRNISIPSGRGPQRAPMAVKGSTRQILKNTNRQMALENVDDYPDETIDVKPLAVSAGSPQINTPKKSEAKLETLILEAIINLKEPTGSNKTTITMYIENQYVPPPDFKQAMSGELQRLTETGKLIKAKHNYKVALRSDFPGGRSSKVLHEGRQREPSREDKAGIKHIKKFPIDTNLEWMELMTAQEAAAAASQAIAKAEIATAEAEEAVRRAESAEADYEESQAFADAVALAFPTEMEL
ncbi:uncharacterized protein A4U43_C07F34550 [Asparagus officinalis]|uniref:MYB transcription factor n=1 Tax=Asparagus officinalis TaxID=4686 RepID=A0A5P1EHC2_ASPOF|nr:single myb histone 1-like [Asparagus officinalis]XP_020274114.1 single myb histone 1-like [Asparagus officinalis]ONK65184.1 uncharacterized protein A4U43_C07F34550 [Asparagus officinalis]